MRRQLALALDRLYTRLMTPCPPKGVLLAQWYPLGPCQSLYCVEPATELAKFSGGELRLICEGCRTEVYRRHNGHVLVV